MAHTYEQNAKPAHLVSAMLILNFSCQIEDHWVQILSACGLELTGR